MFHITPWEKWNLVAAMSAREDGDCSWRPEAVSHRQKLMTECGAAGADLICARQVHGDTVLVVGAAQRGCGAFSPDTAVGEADALLTDVPGLPIAVSVADCVPIWLYAPTKHVGGVVHAGRAGTYHGIAHRAVQRLCDTFTLTPSDVYAHIGPSAGVCCYEVSETLAHDFSQVSLPRSGRFLDLWQANHLHLTHSGLPASNITCSEICTICGERFFSYRQGDVYARNLALLVL